MFATDNPMAIAGMERAGEVPDEPGHTRKLLALEGVPHRRKADHTPAVIAAAEDAPQALLSAQRIRDIITALPPGADMAHRVARAIETEVMDMLLPQVRELLEVARTLAGVAEDINFGASRAYGRGVVDMNHPLHHSRPVVQAAQRLCMRHGYKSNGRPRTGELATHNPEQILLARERGDRDYADGYRWLFSEASRHGYSSVHAAILAAPKGPHRG